jgi:hypothetical protein
MVSMASVLVRHDGRSGLRRHVTAGGGDGHGGNDERTHGLMVRCEE